MLKSGLGQTSDSTMEACPYRPQRIRGSHGPDRDWLTAGFLSLLMEYDHRRAGDLPVTVQLGIAYTQQLYSPPDLGKQSIDLDSNVMQ